MNELIKPHSSLLALWKKGTEMMSGCIERQQESFLGGVFDLSKQRAAEVRETVPAEKGDAEEAELWGSKGNVALPYNFS